MTAGAIIGIILGSLAVCGGGGFCAYFFYLREKLAKKQLREIDRKYQYFHALLIGQDTQYVKRLEIISRTNLLYVETHTKYLKKYKENRDKHDVNTQYAINELKDILDAKKYKEFRNQLPKVTKVVEAYESTVTELNKELLQVIKPEEDCRQSSLAYKEHLRLIKQDYYSKESELVLMAHSFDEVFSYIDSLFEQFESFVESAQYDEANIILPKIDDILHELASKMQDLPNLCTLVSIVLPDKIASVENAYKDMLEQRYPLYHLCVNQTIEEARKDLEKFTQRIRRFDIAGILDKLDEMLQNLDSFFGKFDIEKESRTQFEENNDNVYSVVILIERKFIKLRNTIPEVAKVFVINETHKNKINDIQTDINKVGALKRSLDTFIHSATKQPYSLLVNKMKELSDASNSIISEIDEFNAYINSLKSDAEAAYNTVYSFYDKIKKAEEQVREINVAKISEKYNPQLDKLYVLLNEINDVLLNSPIDIDRVNEVLRELYEIANVILDDGEISQDYNMMRLAENAIIYTNRHRHHFSDIDQLVDQAETYFHNGDFENSYVIAGNALKKIKDENGR